VPGTKSHQGPSQVPPKADPKKHTKNSFVGSPPFRAPVLEPLRVGWILSPGRNPGTANNKPRGRTTQCSPPPHPTGWPPPQACFRGRPWKPVSRPNIFFFFFPPALCSPKMKKIFCWGGGVPRGGPPLSLGHPRKHIAPAVPKAIWPPDKMAGHWSPAPGKQKKMPPPKKSGPPNTPKRRARVLKKTHPSTMAVPV